MPTRILLIRHAESTWNRDGRWQGWADPPLSPEGAAAAVAAKLPELTAVVASDLRRARQTAELMTRRPVHVYRGLRERGAGEWTGLTKAEIWERWGDCPATDIPGGEPPDAVIARAVATLHRIAETWPQGDVLAVSHGALIRYLDQHLGNEPGPVPHLSGRWLEAGGGRLESRDVFTFVSAL